MNQTAAELTEIYEAILEGKTDELWHIGIKRRSGRYPWGSGKDPYQHGDNRDFLGRVDELKAKGWKENAENVYKEFGVSLREYRYEKSICVNERRQARYAQACSLRDDGLNTSEIARRMGTNESSIRSLFDEASKAKMNEIHDTAKFLKEQVDKKKMIDVGKSVELELGIKRERLDTAIYYLVGEGYHDYSGRVPQATNPKQMTTQRVLAAPEIEHKEIYDFDRVKTITDYKSEDGGKTFTKFEYPTSLNSKRLLVRYADDRDPDGYKAVDKDGIIEIRPGCKDLSLGDDRYSQVRIMVDGTHYLKGMAVYSDNLPDGIDVAFNTNKTRDKCPTPKDCLKEIKNDPENPFGSLIKPNGQYHYKDSKGNDKLGLINKRAEQGDWSEWKDQLPAQFLAKQSTQLAKKQLDLARADKADEFDNIMKINNPTIKKYYLNKFAEGCDKNAVTLSAAALPHQKYHVLLPINSLKDGECYAPQYPNGTKVALVRYPHEGIYQIPILTVNNKNKLGQKIIGADSYDAVGIKSKVAEQLSGADFDGDTAMVIPTHDPNGKIKISNKAPLEGLVGFDSKSYQYDSVNGKGQYCRNGIPFSPMSKHTEQIEMGKTANLIMDMTMAGASDDELVRATKHSMVVIDARKHKLDYKQSERDNNIAELKKKYQIQTNADGSVVIDPKTGEPKFGGAATLLSRAKAEADVAKRQGQPKINQKGKDWYDPTKPEGSLIYKTVPDDQLYYTKTKVLKDGTVKEERIQRIDKSTQMMETEDARTLISAKRTKMELLYADYANDMKDWARKARMEMVNTPNHEFNREAKKQYADEVASLNYKLNETLKNSIKERAANRMSASKVKAAIEADPSLATDKKEKAKLRQRTITSARAELGSLTRKERNIKLTDREWEAIQKGAVTNSFLEKLLANCDPDDLRDRATPKETRVVSAAAKGRIKALANSNYTVAEIADAVGLSESTVIKYLKPKEE